MIAPHLAAALLTRVRRPYRGALRHIGRRGARGARLLARAPEAGPLVSPRCPRRGARDGRALAAPDAAGRARALAAARVRRPPARPDRLVRAARGLAARRITRRVLRASPVARMVALAAAPVMVAAVAMLALIAVAIAQL